MKTCRFTIVTLLFGIALVGASVPSEASPIVAGSQQASPGPLAPVPDRARVADALHSNPALFIENVGQFDPAVRFRVGSGTHALWLVENAIWIAIVEPSPVDGFEGSDAERALVDGEDEPRHSVNIKLSFPNANPAPQIVPFDRLDAVVSYLIGDDPDQWHTNVPVWAGVRYLDIYPGIDLELSSAGGQWQWRLIAQPDADLNAVRIRVEGASALTPDGDRLLLTTAIGNYTVPLLEPVFDEGHFVPMLGREPQVRGNQVVFPFAWPTSSSPLPSPRDTMDNPVNLAYSTFLGGADADYGNDIAVDSAGNVYVTGGTQSTDFPTKGPLQPAKAGSTDIFVAKLNATGSALIYATYLGGSSSDWGNGIAVDSSGNAYVTGYTTSTDFPTVNPYQDTFGGGDVLDGDAFVAKLNSSGSALVYSTYLGGRDADQGFGIAVDGLGNAYATGSTRSDNFPTASPLQDFGGGKCPLFNIYINCPDAFAAKLNLSGNDLVYSTYLGGNDYDSGDGIALDASGNVFLAGSAGSSNFPTASPLQPAKSGGRDAFVAKLNAPGSALIYSTFLGGNSDDDADGIAVDGDGAVYVAGKTDSSDFPTTSGALDTTYNGGLDAFAAKVNSSGTALDYSTYLGGSSDDKGNGIAVDVSGNTYLTGETLSSSFPTVQPLQPDKGGGWDAFVSKLNSAGTALDYSTYLGGSSNDQGYGIALSPGGTAYITGRTESSDFPTTSNALDTTYNGKRDAFVAKLGTGGIIEYRVFLPIVLRK